MSKLNAARRNALPNSKFAVIQHRDGKTVRKFPIDTQNRARNALARVANRSSQMKAAVHHKVAEEFPALAARSEAIHGKGKANSPNTP